MTRIPGALPQAGLERAFGPGIIVVPQSLSLVTVHVIFHHQGMASGGTRPICFANSNETSIPFES